MWTRREHTTKGPDPTVIVIWSNDKFQITEFQNVYRLTNHMGDIDGPEIEALARDLHQALESEWQLRQELADEIRAKEES